MRLQSAVRRNFALAGIKWSRALAKPCGVRQPTKSERKVIMGEARLLLVLLLIGRDFRTNHKRVKRYNQTSSEKHSLPIKPSFGGKNNSWDTSGMS